MIEELEQRSAALHAQGDAGEEALEVHRRLLAARPAGAAAANRLGVAHAKRGEYEDALAVFRDAMAADRDNAIAARRVRDLETQIARHAKRADAFQHRPAEEIVEPSLARGGREPALRFLARSIREIQRIDGMRLAVTDLASDRRFRVVGGIYSGVTPANGLLCVSIDRGVGRSVIEAVEGAGGRITDQPGPASAVPETVQLGVPMTLVDDYADALWAPHVAHLRTSLAAGPPTWLHRHDTRLMRYILDQADAL